MDLRQLTIGTGGAISVAALIWYLSRGNGPPHAESSPQSTEDPVRCSDPATCAKVLACEGYNNTGAKNRYTDLKSRAIPNERLVTAFGIDNSFTTSEVKRRKEFNGEAGRTIKMTDAKVGNDSEALSFFESLMQRFKNTDYFHFSILLQLMPLRLVAL